MTVQLRDSVLECGSLHRFGTPKKAAGTASLQDAPATHKAAWPSGLILLHPVRGAEPVVHFLGVWGDDFRRFGDVAFGVGEECWGIEYKTIYGAITNPATWTSLDEFLNRSWKLESGVHPRVASAMIDTSYQSKIVYDFWKPQEPTRKDPMQGIARPPRRTGFVNSWKT